MCFFCVILLTSFFSSVSHSSPASSRTFLQSSAGSPSSLAVQEDAASAAQ